MGTQLTITFTSLDSETPPGSSSVDRVLRIVSPCLSSETYCPNLAQSCGTTACEVREALLGPEAEQHEFFLLRFDDAVLAEAITAQQDGLVLDVHLPCSQPSPLPLTFCLGSASECGVYLGRTAPQSSDLRLTSQLVLPTTTTASGQPRDVCSPEVVQSGGCAHGEHLIQYQAFEGSRNASDVAFVRLHIGERSAVASLSISLSFNTSSAVSEQQRTLIEEGNSQESGLTNRVLRTAERVIAAAVERCAWDVLSPFYRGGGDTNATFASLTLAQAPSVTLQAGSDDNTTTVQVCCQC